jgi:hypothetical protein
MTKREDPTAARERAARQAGEAAKVQKKVHDPETKLRAEEELEATKADEERRAAEKKAACSRTVGVPARVGAPLAASESSRESMQLRHCLKCLFQIVKCTVSA